MKAVEELIDSEDFKRQAKTDSNLRVFKTRFNKGELKNGAMVDLLINFGYTIEVKGGKKVVSKK